MNVLRLTRGPKTLIGTTTGSRYKSLFGIERPVDFRARFGDLERLPVVEVTPSGSVDARS